MEYVSATEAKQNFAAMIDKTRNGPVVIQNHQRDVAALVSMEDYDLIRKGRWTSFWEAADELAAEAKKNGLTEEILAEILAND
jgi:prevent-host-death family protein